MYHCDNDVVDHQTVNLEFENNIHATFTMTAFTEQTYRTIRITGTKGEIEGDINSRKLVLRRFGQPEEIIDLALAKNKNARVCVSAIAVETLSAAVAALTKHGLEANVTQIAVSRTRPAGKLHLLMANNPTLFNHGRAPCLS